MPASKIELKIGDKFGKLTIINNERFYRNNKYISYECKCECGNVKIVRKDYLLSKEVKSCGCIKGGYNTHGRRHAGTNDPTYSSWMAMLSRCRNPKNSGYYMYGEKGISVCARWSIPKRGFENFVEDMGNRPPNTSIDRIDSKGNYEPGNCRWASPLVQSRMHLKPKDHEIIEILKDDREDEETMLFYANKFNVHPRVIRKIKRIQNLCNSIKNDFHGAI